MVFEFIVGFTATNVSYGFTLGIATPTGIGLKSYTCMIPLTATTMYYSNQYATDTGTVATTVPLYGTAKLYGIAYTNAGMTNPLLQLRIKVESGTYPITFYTGEVCGMIYDIGPSYS